MAKKTERKTAEAVKALEGKLVKVVIAYPDGQSEPRKMIYAGKLNNQHIFVDAVQENLDGSQTPRGELANGSSDFGYDGRRTFTLYNNYSIRSRELTQIRGVNLQRILTLWGNRKY